ncbi:MAG: DUF1949 domain-containing protein, partial [Clostridia bacterium]|nr:DUF1949 domain-containing protein [Clostridia bacterium]
FGADVSLTILLPTDTVEGFRKELLDLSAGRCDLTVLGEEYTEL